MARIKKLKAKKRSRANFLKREIPSQHSQRIKSVTTHSVTVWLKIFPSQKKVWNRNQFASMRITLLQTRIYWTNPWNTILDTVLVKFLLNKNRPRSPHQPSLCVKILTQILIQSAWINSQNKTWVNYSKIDSNKKTTVKEQRKQ